MRYLTVLARPTESGAFHPIGEALSAESSIGREAIHQVELLADGTVLLLAEGSGDRDQYAEIMRDSPDVIDHMVSGERTGRWMAVSQFEPTAPMRRILELERDSDIIMEMPIRIADDGSLRITHLGSESSLRTLFREVMSELPLTFEVVKTGAYEPDEEAFTRLLTARQREVLEAAVEVGYYGAPRRATHEDVAAAVGIAPVTAGEHLRKIEERVFGALVR